MARGGDHVVGEAARAMARQSFLEVDAQMEMDFVDWSCCCCSRRRGVLILGICFVFLSLGALVICSMAAAHLSEMHVAMRNTTEAPKKEKLNTAPAPETKKGVQKPPTEADIRLVEGVYSVLATQAVMAAVGVATAAALAAGASTRRPGLLLPWLVCSGAEVALLIGCGAYFVAASISRSLPIVGIHGFFAFVFMLLACVPLIYCMKAVHCLYKELRGLRKAKQLKKVAGKKGDSAAEGKRPDLPPPPPPGEASAPAPAAATATKAAKRPPPTVPLRRTRYGSLGEANQGFENTAL